MRFLTESALSLPCLLFLSELDEDGAEVYRGEVFTG